MKDFNTLCHLYHEAQLTYFMFRRQQTLIAQSPQFRQSLQQARADLDTLYTALHALIPASHIQAIEQMKAELHLPSCPTPIAITRTQRPKIWRWLTYLWPFTTTNQ
jgi:hypothetical protein